MQSPGRSHEDLNQAAVTRESGDLAIVGLMCYTPTRLQWNCSCSGWNASLGLPNQAGSKEVENGHI